MLNDTIVVGSGRGGATWAHFPCAAGRRIVVLDEAEPSRFKPCCGGIGSQTRKRLVYGEAAPARAHAATL